MRKGERLIKGDRFLLVFADDLRKGVRLGDGGTSEPDTAFFCGSNAFALALPGVFALLLRHIGEHLKHQVGDKSARKVARAGAGIQKRHIQNEYVRAKVFCDVRPLPQYHVVISAQAVKAVYDEQIAIFEFAYKFFVIAPFKVFSGKFIGINVVFRYPIAAKPSNCRARFWLLEDTLA